MSETNVQLAKEKLEDLGFIVTFSKNCKERDIMISSSVKSRIDDIHEAFSDKNVKAIFTIIGGFNSNQLLKYLDYDLIRSNPKIFCGYSGITAIANAITHKTDGVIAEHLTDESRSPSLSEVRQAEITAGNHQVIQFTCCGCFAQ